MLYYTVQKEQAKAAERKLKAAAPAAAPAPVAAAPKAAAPAPAAPAPAPVAAAAAEEDPAERARREAEAIVRGKERAAAMSKRMCEELAGKLSIPKLKDYLKQGGAELPKSSAKKADYVEAAMAVSGQAGWEKSVLALQALSSVQAKGFGAGAGAGAGAGKKKKK